MVHARQHIVNMMIIVTMQTCRRAFNCAIVRNKDKNIHQ